MAILSLVAILTSLPVIAETCGIVVTQETPLTVRRHSSYDSYIVGKASRGSALRILYHSRGWYKVKLNNGTTGYSNADYIKEVTGRTYETCGIVVTRSGRLNIRSRPSQTAGIVSKAHKGSALRIIERERYWSYVKTNDGTYGYASNDYIKQLN